MSKVIRYIVTLLILQFIMVESFSMDIDNDFKIDYKGIEDGLSNNSVTSIYQDDKGFIWIGTFDGLNRFDGYDFKLFRNQPGDDMSLIHNRIVSISGTGDEIWVGTKKGLSIYNFHTGTFLKATYKDNKSTEQTILSYPVNEVYSHKGKVYIGTAGKGLLVSDGDKGNCERVPLGRDNEISWDYHVQGIDFAVDGVLWCFVQGEGIAKFDETSKRLKIIYSAVKSGRCMTFDDEDNLWVGLDNGLLKYNIKEDSSFIFSHKEVRFQYTSIIYLEDRQQIWASTDGNGIIGFNLNEKKFFTITKDNTNNGLSSNSIYCMFQDKDKRIWLGTIRGGINTVEEQNEMFQTVAINEKGSGESLSNNYISAFCEQDENNVWIGTDGSGLYLWNMKQNTYTNYSNNPKKLRSLPSNFITNIKKEPTGLWVATYGGGICRFDEKTHNFIRYSLFDDKHNVNHLNIWTLFVDSKHVLWAGSSDQPGIFKYNQETDSFEYLDVPFIGILSIKDDQLNDLWVGTFSELSRFNSETMDIKSFKMDYPVRSIVPINKNAILIGTEGGGLIKLDPVTGEQRVFIEKDGLCNNSVLNIIKDDNDFYWLSTYNGISRFDIRTEQFVNYYDSDGLQSNQFSYNAGLMLTSGKILLGGIKGFNIVNPGVTTTKAKFPNLLITQISVNNVNIEKSGKSALTIHRLKLPSDRSMLTINYVGVEYSKPNKILYAYYLDGWDFEWHYVGKSRVANYSKLTEGNYTLKIKSTNADGTWRDDYLELPIIITPPWYRSKLAYFFYLVFVVGVIYMIYSYKKKQNLLRYEIRLSEEKIKYEQELSEKKLNFFTTVSHEFRLPLTMIINPLKDMLYGGKIEPGAISMAYRSSRRLLNMVDQLLMFRKIESERNKMNIRKLDIIELCNEVYSSFIHLANSKDVDYRFFTSIEREYIYADRQKMEICLHNLISNAFKYTDVKGGRVILKVKQNQNPDELIIQVSDNGIGVKDDDKEMIFNLFYQSHQSGSNELREKGFGIGLYIVEMYVKQHHGVVRCYDNGTGGSIFEIRLKMGKEHFAGFPIDEEASEGSNFEKVRLNLQQEQAAENQEIFDESEDMGAENQMNVKSDLILDRRYILLIDNDLQSINFMKKILFDQYIITEALTAQDALAQIKQKHPDLIVSDVLLKDMNGVDLCRSLKEDSETQHIPVILLTAAISEEIKLKGIEVGADDYLTKPFDQDYLKAKINGIFKRREVMQDRLLKIVTLNSADFKLSDQDKEFLDQIVEIVENAPEKFNITKLSSELGMSHSLLYKKVKQLTGKTVIEFVRFIRLRMVAVNLITMDVQINQAALAAGFNDLKYFRKHFQSQYGMSPSAFQKKYKSSLQDKQYILKDSF
ncbi:hybrid sensor histidine kinase/response regulator transcription factor [Sunxiuqinia indica]|uniref:hybrid sensor histidine kinase/response regulator transcription factor n=1 Tax=Sunxiuqinia indica TaxID=2692584 RepID=UPI001357AE16|nr:hybrid sensor histidine kinase/response regulator transcription factor [Sunxiuqinia indica]